MATITAAEQLLIELINRGRLDPAGEAKRYGTTLNADLASGTINDDAKQVLAPNDLLSDAADGHSEWMLAVNRFSHTGAGGSSPGDRMDDAGYNFNGNWSWGENIAWAGTTGVIDMNAVMHTHHRGLIRSSGHRENLMNGSFQEIGIGQINNNFRSGGTTYDTSMVTENFARSGNSVFLTGVVFDDHDGDRFYSVGEGRGGASFTVNSNSTTTAAAGGYALELSPAGSRDVTVSWGGFNGVVTVDFSKGNVKLDLLVDDFVLLSSADTILGAGSGNATLLGVAALDLTGNDADNVLTGNAGNNRIEGLDGADDLDGAKGNDKLFGGAGDDELSGGKGKDKLYGGDQNDTLSGGKDADKLKGGYGDDRLIGGSGADKLKGDEGDDWLTGGKHADTFIFAGNFGIDTITDFKGSDRINLKDVNSARNFSDLKSNHASQAGDDVHLDYGANRLILANVDLDDLRADDFIF